MAGFVRTLEYLFGCHHGNLSRVFTIEGRTYRVCCDCGAKFDYSFNEMLMGRRVARAPAFRWMHIT
jgi:hypothetical protein